jgi:hypothetical protein
LIIEAPEGQLRPPRSAVQQALNNATKREKPWNHADSGVFSLPRTFDVV